MGIPGSNIRRTRRKRGLSLKSLAKKAGISLTYLSEIERGEANVSSNVIKNIAKALNVPLGAFYAGKDIPDAVWMDRFKSVPFFSSIPPVRPDEGIVELGEYPLQAGFWKSNRYAFRIYNEVLPPVLFANDVVLIEHFESLDPKIGNGKICVVWCGEMHVLGRFKIEESNGEKTYTLVTSESPRKVITFSDQSEFLIQGVVLFILERRVI